MAFYTDKQIEAYKAGWLETHPDEVLDDETVEAILDEEERDRMIELLIRSDIECDFNGGNLFETILLEGFTGYRHESDINLRDEVKERGLENDVWGDLMY